MSPKGSGNFFRPDIPRNGANGKRQLHDNRLPRSSAACSDNGQDSATEVGDLESHNLVPLKVAIAAAFFIGTSSCPGPRTRTCTYYRSDTYLIKILQLFQ